MADQTQKLALLVGMTGAGKSTIADSFGDDVYVIHFDPIIRQANLMFCPQLKQGKEYVPGLIEFIRDPEPMVAGAIAKVMNGNLSNDKPIIAEGGSLSFPTWRNAFVESLKLLGFSIGEVNMFWQRTDISILLEQQRQRRESTRPNEKVFNQEEMQSRLLKWDERLKGRADVVVEGDADQTLARIAGFLNIETPELKLN